VFSASPDRLRLVRCLARCRRLADDQPSPCHAGSGAQWARGEPNRRRGRQPEREDDRSRRPAGLRCRQKDQGPQAACDGGHRRSRPDAAGPSGAANTPATRMAMGSARSTSTRSRVSGHCCARGCARTVASRRRSCRTTSASSRSCTTHAAEAEPFSAPSSRGWLNEVPLTTSEPDKSLARKELAPWMAGLRLMPVIDLNSTARRKQSYGRRLSGCGCSLKQSAA